MTARSITFINRVYPPAEGATGQLLAELAPELVRAGWQVTVVTSGAGEGAPRSEVMAGVRIERVRGLPFTRASLWRRALSYLSLYPALLWRTLRLPRADVVVTLTDPPLQLLLGSLLQGLKRSCHVHWAQDLYPEVAEEVGVLRRGGRAAGILRRLSTWALRRSDGVIAVGRCMKERLLARGLAADSVEVILNWGHALPDNAAAREENLFRREHGLKGRFVIMYSGNLGLAHPFEAMLDAAQRLEATLPEAVLLFVGDGPRLPWVKSRVAELNLGNVRFLPFQPREKLGASLTAADLHLASMREGLCGLVVPSKVSGVLTAGRPCVFLGPAQSEAARLVHDFDCGSVLEQADGAVLAACLTEWVRDPQRLATAGRNSLRAAELVSLARASSAFVRLLNRQPPSLHRAGSEAPEEIASSLAEERR